ncbi:tyrosine-type recombinase/integrase [Bradyrhizobium jicamae]|uniref:Tyrosine-type recombinase/integrase n=1 Tax=Bradyrhizobium jicamae TaxID=280332 RepID=A0ABS5FMD1_9BRAD|nr:site-specific integrase [Bradyrhizobium jicamae]MBR0797961.1 tyrosine-type recombinase/integrase [Bradyrhizobium jicamae]
MAKSLTAAAVASCRPAKARRELPDGGCPGLHLVVQPTGSKSWALRYRRPDRRTAKLVIGSVFERDGRQEPSTDPVIGGHLTLAAARRLVAELRHDIAQGRDPGAVHIREKIRRRAGQDDPDSNTFAAAAKDFIDQHAKKKTRRWHEQARLLGLRPEDLAEIKHGLSERWSKRALGEISRHDIHDIVEETRRKGAPGLQRRREGMTESRARAMLSCLSKMFGWLEQRGRVDSNPCAGIHRPETPRARDRILTDNEIERFWSAASAERSEFAGVLKLLLLTGCRLNEVAGISAEELSEDRNSWTIPGSRTKNHLSHVVPLARIARKLLLETKRDSGLIFTTNGKTRIGGWSKLKKRLDKSMDTTHWRFHDLRRTAATGMAKIGIAPHVVEAVLNHVSGARAGVAGTYNRHAYFAEKRVALERWADHIDTLVTDRLSRS